MKPAERRALLSHKDLLTMLHYAPETGRFTWLVDPNPLKKGRVRAGDVAGTPAASDHTVVTLWRTRYLAHRLAFFYMTGRWPVNQIDHRNGVRTDNRWVNLREATFKQQRENATPQRRSTSGVRGVYWFKRTQQWRACINHNKRAISLGYHEKFEDAVIVRKAAEMKYWTHHREVT